MKHHTKYEQFLNSHKTLVGLSDWKIILNTETDDKPEELANLEINIYEKEITITLNKEYSKLTTSKKKNVLLHELIHSRIDLFNKKKLLIVEDLEEELANDLVRGFERHKTLKW